MKSTRKKRWKPYMLRPTLYKALSRFLYSLTLALLWDRFINLSGILSVRFHAFALLGLFWGFLAWFSYLKLDGIRLPRLPIPRIRHRSDDFAHRDMADFADEPVVSYDDLEEDERTLCSLIADLICCVILLLLSFL